MSQSKEKIVCPVCKDLIQRGEFIGHVTKCTGGRIKCDNCSATFKKQIYMIRHRQNIHKAPVATAASTEKHLSESSSSESDTWDSDPEIDLGGSETVSKQTKSPESTEDVNDGRTVRKPTQPLPVSAPKKRTIDKEAPSQLPVLKKSKIDQSVKVDIDIRKAKTTSHEVTVNSGGVKVYGLYRIGRDDGEGMRSTISLGDFMPSDTMIRPSDVKITTIFTPDGGQVLVDIQKDE